LAWLVGAVFPVVRVFPLPVPVAVLSSGLTETNPATESALAALIPDAEKLTVMLSEVVRAVVIEAENTNVCMALFWLIMFVATTSRV
jgi:hypothetical protein